MRIRFFATISSRLELKLCETTTMANSEFGTGKSVFILTIVAGCFAILWPKIFYPMIAGTEPVKRPIDVSGGCCDVVYEKDVEVLRVLSEMCGRVNGAMPGTVLTSSGAATCREAVLDACNIDIATFLNKVEQSKLGRSHRQNLDELRSFNTSTCLRRNFGVTPESLGSPRRMRTWGPTTSRHLRQERPPHLKPEGLHPALRERGRAIPASHIVPVLEKEPTVAARPPLPGMRPPMGGAGHVVPAPKTGGTMGIVMPLYTIGIVVFFMYTIMKVFVRKTSEDDTLRDFQPDPDFRRFVFADDPDSQRSQRSVKEPTPPAAPAPVKASTADVTRLGWKERDTILAAIGGLMAEVDKHLEGTPGQYSADPQVKTEPGDDASKNDAKVDNQPEQVTQINTQTDDQKDEDSVPEKNFTEIKKRPKTDKTMEFVEAERQREQEQRLQEEEKQRELDEVKEGVEAPAVLVENVEVAENEDGPCVRVVGVETRARAEGGREWNPAPSPVLGQPHSRPVTPVPPEWQIEPHNIFLEGTLPSNSQLLVEDAATELLDDSQQDPAVILSGKMTLSLISMDAPQQMPPPTVPSEPESTLLDIETAIIDDSSVDGDGEDDEGVAADEEIAEELTHYTTANTAANPSVANALNSATNRQDPEADDTAADISAQDLLDDQEDLQEEYDAIWGAIEMDEEEEEQVDKILEPATGTQHHR